MEPRPFGRRQRPQSIIKTEPATQMQFLEAKNAIWDMHQVIVSITDQLQRVIATQSDHDRALTHFDGDIHRLKAALEGVPASPGQSGTPRMHLVGPATAPDMAARGDAWERLIAGLIVYIGQGVTGEQLKAVLDQAVVEVEVRTGLDAGMQP